MKTGRAAQVDASASEKIIPKQNMSEGEQRFLLERQQIVQKALSKLGIDSSKDSIPRIAVLGSGGGERAAVGMLGSLYQMEKEGLMDAVSYVAGVSGSTWTMSSLYQDPQWSKNIDAAEARLIGSDFEEDKAHSWLDEKLNDDYFSLSDVWGLITSAKVMKQMELRQLSHEASRNASIPYPVYNAIEKLCFHHGPTEGKWFELTPHEAGFTDLGFFVKTSLLGSKFENGVLTEKNDEMDMMQLQGILGSAIADVEVMMEELIHWLKGILGSAYAKIESTMEELLHWFKERKNSSNSTARSDLHAQHTLTRMIFLSRSSAEHAGELPELDNLQRIIDDQIQRNDSRWQECKTEEEKEALAQELTLELLAAVGNWSDSLPVTNAPTSNVFSFSPLEGIRFHCKILSKIIPLLVKWEWGTTANYLHKYKDSSIPDCLHTHDKFYLMDAGLMINVPYPPFLGDRRDIDLIIAFDYSAGEIFQTLTLARDYAAEVNKSFPELDEKSLKEKDWPRDFYVFGGDEESDLAIVYIPLFNRSNTKDAEELKKKMSEFSTFQRPYSPEMVQSELQVAKDNVKNNKKSLLSEISKAAVRRRRKQEKKRATSLQSS